MMLKNLAMKKHDMEHHGCSWIFPSFSHVIFRFLAKSHLVLALQHSLMVRLSDHLWRNRL